ncbi:ABC transporter ATP-binding protein [Nitrococcus mobilis]|uniref:ABC-type spermidine/putrescine transport system, ATPase component n=1 Tax=Nitrococcus mobilis Nb-231 TaxID=314278 RepID=A4BMY4_9GAMM|nr:ATP-binding cassette domain-containing protein [Nitrococcus mobilis]EAR22583.1 ABC-type spermidine/putrescine transport system, ATPase component [Nitrococcus mobilis Nb-231]
MSACLVVENLDCGSVREVNFTLAVGECVSLAGASGSGKTRLLRAIADLDVHSGTVRLGGKDRQCFTPAQWRRRVTMVPAESHWWADTVGVHLNGSPDVDLEALGFGPEVRGWAVRRLSSGERQRLGLARAAALEPVVMLLDEPTANLDAEAIERVEHWLAERRQRDGTAILWVTHNAAQAVRVAQRGYRITASTLQQAFP